MAIQEVWVHGSSGQLDVFDVDWGKEHYDGTGLYLEANVQKGQYPIMAAQIIPPPNLWVLYHIPTPTGAENAAKLKKVKLRFSTDCNPAGVYPQHDPQFFQTTNGYEKDILDAGGAIIDAIHVTDAERLIGTWQNLGWQSSNMMDFIPREEDFDPAMEVHWGVCVAVRLSFKNQLFVEKRVSKTKNASLFPLDKDWEEKGKHPWLNRAVATKTKQACIASVGCEFITPSQQKPKRP